MTDRFHSLLSAFVFKFIFWTALALGSSIASAAPFRLHVAKEPTNLDPHTQSASGSSYVLQNLFRNLYVYDNETGLVPDLAESCKRKSESLLVCRLKKDLKWSDGTALTAADFVASYKRILDAKTAAPRADQLFNLKNAESIFKGLKKPDELGVTAPDPLTLQFEFQKDDPEFEHLLSSYLLAPVKVLEKSLLQKSFSQAGAPSLVTSGPYKVTAWKPGDKISLKTNLNYLGGRPSFRPEVEVLFIPEDSVALQLYEKGTLSFLRRLPTLYIPTFKKRPDFLWVPVIRFDYIGFGPALKDNAALREALAYSLNYPELQKIFSSEGVPGCPGIPEKWQKEVLCYKMDLPRAQAALKKAKPTSSLQFSYSVLGGEDHRRATEWLQSQWKTNLGLQVQTFAKDNKVFLNDLTVSPPAIFRKGATPDRATCLAALEIFSVDGPENYLRLKDPAYSKILEKMAKVKNASSDAMKALCSEGVRYLLDRYLMIPTGPIHFAMLAKKEFTGWRLNHLNQLDLAALQEQKKE